MWKSLQTLALVFSTLATVPAAASIAALATQDSPPTPPKSESAEHLQVLGKAGHWKGKGRYLNLKFTCEMDRWWADDQGAMFFTQRYYPGADRTSDVPSQINSGMFGWDATNEEIKSCWFITDGRSATDRFPGGQVQTNGVVRLKGTRKLSGADGTLTTHEVQLDLHPDGQIDYQSADRETGQVIIEIQWRRVDPEND